MTPGALILALAVGSIAPAPTASPSPVPSLVPLKEIGRVRSSTACNALHDVLGPAIGNVLGADQAIASGRPMLERYARDTYVLGAGASSEMDLMRLENAIGPLVNNLTAAQRVLNDWQLPTAAGNDDERLLLESRNYLREVTDQQQAALNDLNGTLETARLGQLQRAGPEHSEAFSTPDQVKAKVGSGTSDVLDAGVAHSPREQADLNFSGATGFGYNPAKAAISDVKAVQTQIESSESKAAAIVVLLERNCAQP